MDTLEQAIELYSHCSQNTPFFSLQGIKAYARVLDVYDGDTITIALNIYGTTLKFRCRLFGIDTCEITTKNIICKELAFKARNRLIELISNKVCPNFSNKKQVTEYFAHDVIVVWINCFEQDKFGRILVNIFSNSASNESFSDLLVEERLAYRYMGETKLSEEQQIALLTH